MTQPTLPTGTNPVNKATALRRASDRLITPLTVSVALTLLVIVAGGLTWGELWARGHGYPAGDVIDTFVKVVSSLAALISSVAFLTQRHQMSRIEVGVNKPAE